MAKSLNLCQCITDGGIYEFKKVNHWNLMSSKPKPGFHVLANNALKQYSSCITPLGYQPLNQHNINWDFELKKASVDIEYRNVFIEKYNKLALQHIQNFLK